MTNYLSNFNPNSLQLQVYRPPPTKLMKTKRKITSDEEVTKKLQ